MKYTNIIAAMLMSISLALAAPAIAKDPVQGLANSLEAAARAFLKAPNISVPGTGPKPTSISTPIDGAPIETRDNSPNISCDLWEDDHGMYSVTADSVRENIKTLRDRSDKPPTLASGVCEVAVCVKNSGIAWCVGDVQYHDDFTLDSWSQLADAAQAMLDTCSPNNEYVDAEADFDHVWLAVASYMTKNCDD